MAEPVKDSTLTNTNSRLTGDKGTGYGDLAKEEIQFFRDKNGKPIGIRCEKYSEISDPVLALDKPATKSTYLNELEKQYQVLSVTMFALKLTSTSCLLKAAGCWHQLLMLYVALPDNRKIPTIANNLFDIYNEVEKRTRKPYQYMIVFNDKELFQPLHPSVLKIFPLSQIDFWKQIIKQSKKFSSSKGKGIENYEGLIPIIDKEENPVDEKQLDHALEIAEANTIIKAELGFIPPNDSPLVNYYRANLDKLTTEDVYKQTKFRTTLGDYKLSSYVDVIFYVSSYTIVLDKEGEPFDAGGVLDHFHYGMILISKKFKTIKLIPPPGQYISLGPLAGQQFEIDGGIVKKIPIQYGGVLGYKEMDVTGSWEADYQVKANEDFGKNHMYMGSIVTQNAFGSKDVGLIDIASVLPEIVEETMPYFFKAVEKRLKQWYENPGEIILELAKEALKTIIIETLKDVAKKYIIKKIGKRIIPVINVLAALKDLVDVMRYENEERDTIAINCVRMYLKADENKAFSENDKSLAKKILANIMADEFENAIKSKIINYAVKKGMKLVNRVRGKVGKSTEKKEGAPEAIEQPKPTTETPKQPEAGTQTTPQKPGTIDPKAVQQGIDIYTQAGKGEKQKTGEDESVKGKGVEKKSEGDKKKEQGTDNKATTRPQDEEKKQEAQKQAAKGAGEEKPDPEKQKQVVNGTADKGKEDDDKKKQQSDRLALIKARQEELNKKKAEEEKKKAQGTNNNNTQNKKLNPPPDPKTAADEVEAKGKKTRRGNVAKRSRKEAIDDALESVRAGNPTPQGLFSMKRLEEEYGREAVTHFMDTGKLPRDIEYSHLFSVSEYPEFAHRGDLGALTPKREHREKHHGGNTRIPLHGFPRIPEGDDEPEDE